MQIIYSIIYYESEEYQAFKGGLNTLQNTAMTGPKLQLKKTSIAEFQTLLWTYITTIEHEKTSCIWLEVYLNNYFTVTRRSRISLI